jgi:protein-tyrosine kinase
MNARYELNERVEPTPTVQSGAQRLLGRILVNAGKLQAQDVDTVLAAQQNLGVRFGEAAVKLKLVSRGDLHDALSRQLAATTADSGNARLSGELVTAYQAFTAPAEAVRRLRTELLLRWFTSEHKLLAVVSAGRRDGRSYMAANLAVALSQLGERTLLVDADMRSPRQHAIFNVDPRAGLSSVLGARSDADVQARIARIAELPNLSLLAAGPIPPNPLDLLGQPAFARFLTLIRQRYDVVLIDTPAGNLNADAQLIAARCGGALYVARKDRSRTVEMKRLIGSIAAAGSVLVGTALNRY